MGARAAVVAPRMSMGDWSLPVEQVAYSLLIAPQCSGPCSPSYDQSWPDEARVPESAVNVRTETHRSAALPHRFRMIWSFREMPGGMLRLFADLVPPRDDEIHDEEHRQHEVHRDRGSDRLVEVGLPVREDQGDVGDLAGGGDQKHQRSHLRAE